MRAIVMAIVLPALLTACTPGVRGPRPAEIARAQDGQETIVFLRLQATIGGEAKRVLQPSLIQRFLGRRWALGLAALDTYGEPEFTSPPHSPSSQAAHDGWVMLSLPPGAYWLSIVPSDAWRSGPTPQGEYGYHTGGFVPAPAFLLEVRGREPLLYAGTLAFTQNEEATPRAATPDRPGGGAIGEVPVVRMIDESDRARSTLARELPMLRSAEMVTRLLEPYGSQLAPEAIHALVPMGLGTLAAAGIRGPGWYQRPLMLWLTPAGALIGAAAYGGGEGAGAIFALGVAYVPVGLFGGTVHGTIRKLLYDPCVDELTKRLRETSPVEWLWKPIADAFAAHLHEMPLDVGGDAGGAPKNVRGVLLATVTRVQLHQVGSDVAVTVGLRARLWSVATRRWVYDRSFSYDPTGIPPARPYEDMLPGTPPARALGAYCPPDGWNVVQNDLREATRLLIAQLRSDLGWKDLAAEGERGDAARSVTPEIRTPGVAWVADFDTASRLASEQGKLVVLYLSTIDCSHCAKVEHEVYVDPEFVEFSRSQIFIRRLGDEPEGKRLVERFAVRSFPTWLVLTPDRQVLGRVEGFRDANTLVGELQQIMAQRSSRRAVTKEEALTQALPTPSPPAPPQTIQLTVSGGTDDVAAKLFDEIRDEAAARGLAVDREASDATLSVTIAEFSPGSQLLRWLIDFGAGRGTLAYHVKYSRGGTLIADREGRQEFKGNERSLQKEYGLTVTLGGVDTATKVLLAEAAEQIVDLVMRQ